MLYSCVTKSYTAKTNIGIVNRRKNIGYNRILGTAPSCVVCHIQKERHSSFDMLDDIVWFP